jgi:hypothetical protein
MVKQRDIPVRILTSVDEGYEDVLGYYGLTNDWIESKADISEP